jgi:hypothetical protein
MDSMEEKKELIEQIKLLIAIDGETVHINPNYLEYFELEELESIKDDLLEKKKQKDQSSKEYLDQIYEKLI